MTSIKVLPDSATDDTPGADLFDVIIRRDDSFTLGNIDDFNVDPDFAQFSILCFAYVRSIKHLITINIETVDGSAIRAASLMKGQLYACVVSYNADGSVKNTDVMKIRLSSVNPVVHGESKVVQKSFIFDIEN